MIPGGSDGKASACNAGNRGSIPGSGRSPGEGNGNPLQYSCLENPMDGESWKATVHGVAERRRRLSDFTYLPYKLVLFGTLKICSFFLTAVNGYSLYLSVIGLSHRCLFYWPFPEGSESHLECKSSAVVIW